MSKEESALFRSTVLVLLIYRTLSQETLTFDCYSDIVFGNYSSSDKVIVLNCSNKSLDSHVKLTSWLNVHSVFSKLISKPKHDFIILYENNRIANVTRFPSLPRARLLSFSHNVVSSIVSGAFAGLTNLQHLDLSHNAITAKILRAAVFSGTSNQFVHEPLPIKTLKLNSNLIHSLSYNVFEHLPFLKELDISNNPFKVLDYPTQVALASLSNLKFLDLGYTQLRKLPPDLFRQNPIEVLYLNGNKMEVVPEELKALEGTLETLNLNDNLIAEISPGPINSLRNLVELNLNAMSRLQRIESKSFSELKRLRKFVCSYNPVLTELGPHLFHHPPSELILRNNALSTLSKELVTQWEEVENLDLQGNPWNCDCSVGWLSALLALRTFRDPEFYMDVKCQQPEWLHGQLLDSLAEYLSSTCRHSALRRSFMSSNLKLQTTMFILIAFVIVIALVFTLRGRLNLSRFSTFWKKDPRLLSSRSQIQTNIKYKRANDSEKYCELAEYNRDSNAFVIS